MSTALHVETYFDFGETLLNAAEVSSQAAKSGLDAAESVIDRHQPFVELLYDAAEFRGDPGVPEHGGYETGS